MIERIHVTPVEGRLVRKLDRAALPEGGLPVEDSSYWRRLERDGDVTIGPVVDAPEEEPAEPSKARTTRTNREAEA